MKKIDADRLDELAEEYSTHADHCRHMAESAPDAFREEWVRLAATWTRLAEETKAKSHPI